VSQPTPATLLCTAPYRPAAWVALIVGLCLATAGCGGFAAQGMNADGVQLFEQGQYQQAIEQFDRAIINDPNNADSYYNLAAVYHRLGTQNKSQSDLDQAEHYYNMCRDRDPNHRECYRGLAVLFVEQNRKDEAFQLIREWADRNPVSPEPKVELARLYEEFGNRKAAKEHLLEALASDPTHTRALAALGKLREEMGDRAQALADYQRSLWHDRFQPEVAARVAALQSALSPEPLVTLPETDTRTVTRDSTPRR